MRITRQQTAETKEAITTAAIEFTKIAGERHREELTSDIADLLSRMGEGLFRLVVMGEIKKGKSSFLNALLGLGGLLPTDVDVATSTVYKIIHGPERKVKVFFEPDAQTGRQMEPLEIAESQVAEYGTEAGNPGNRKRVDFIAVELPSDLLAAGLAIVDTPGVGGLYKSHRGITWRYAPNADAVIFVLDSTESVISSDEIDFLKELTGKITRHVYFVQTKTDMAGREQREAWELRNKEILAKELPDLAEAGLRYFPISSKLKRQGEELKMDRLIEDSGFSAVETFLRDELIAAKDYYLCQELAKPLLGKFGVLRDALAGEARAAQAETGQELEAMRKELESRQKELVEWEQTVFQNRQQEFSDRFRDLRQDAVEDLQSVLDPQSPQLTSTLERLRQMPNVTADKLDAEIRNIQSNMIAWCIETGQAGISRFASEVDATLSGFCREVAAHIPQNQLVARSGSVELGSWRDGVAVQSSLNLSQTGFETTRNVIGGGMMGFGLTATVCSILTGGLALVPAIFIGLAFAGGAAAAAERRKLDEALAKTERILRETVMALRNKALQDFNRVASDRERSIRDLFKAAIKSTRDQYEREITQIRDRGTQSQEALRKAAAERSAVLKTLGEHALVLQKILQTPVTM